MGNGLDEPSETRPDEEPPGGLPERIGRYRILRQLGSGGMGVVYAAKHVDSTQLSAVKVIRDRLGQGDELARRFRREGELLKGLRHPGIAAFYDAGEAELETKMGTTRVPFLAMELVEGESLLEYAWRRKLGVSQRTELLARVADALQHAHEAGIVHRDLKPGNVHVVEIEDDPVGQPKLLDFGIALASDTDVHTAVTRTGAMMGTVPYMSPELISGGAKAVDARSDVYALGVILFELLAGRLPYTVTDVPLPEAIHKIQFAAPHALGSIVHDLRGDLEWILERALEKEPERRYASASDLAADLRAANAGRPVSVRPLSVMRRTRRFIGRYPITSTVVGTSLLGLLGISLLWVRAVQARDLAVNRAELARNSAALAQERQEDVRRERQNVLRLADQKRLDDLVQEAEQLWPVHPRLVDPLDLWLEHAQELLARLPDHRSSLEELEAGPQESLSGQERQWWLGALRGLVVDLERFEAQSVPDVHRRFEASASLAQRSIAAYAADWEEAINEVGQLEAYDGLNLAPQVGLVPLGADPFSGLWEFWHVESGQRPSRDPGTGVLRMEEESGVVLVLLPGGSFAMGAQAQDANGSNYDPQAEKNEAPVREIRISPCLVSKYELTQGQWLRAMGSNPAFNAAGGYVNELLIDLRHPVESVTWNDARTALHRYGLELLTEAQWEYATRAGTTTPWWSGATKEGLDQAENLADQFCRQTNGPTDWDYEPWDDGYHSHAPVGSFLPNAFGLFDMGGNVAEWCLDGYAAEAYTLLPETDPLLAHEVSRFRSVRGSDFSHTSERARVSYRDLVRPDNRSRRLGLRPARALEKELDW